MPINRNSGSGEYSITINGGTGKWSLRIYNACGRIVESSEAKIELYREDVAAEELEQRNKLYDEIYRGIFEICRCGRRAFRGVPKLLQCYRTIK